MEQIVEDMSQLLLKPECPKKKQAQLVCCSLNCKNNAFICLDKSCVCQGSMHQDCDIKKLSSFIKIVKTRREQTDKSLMSTYTAIRMIYQEVIERLTNDMRSLKNRIFKLGLTAIERQFYDMVSSKQWNMIDGDFMGKLKIDLSQSKNNSSQKTQSQQIKIKKFWELTKPQFNNFCNQIKQLGKGNLELGKEKLKFSSLKLDSKISNDSQLICSFLGRSVKGFKLLYRASENYFSSETFHSICDKIPNTLTLALTQFNKIIGGYTPLTFQMPDSTDKADPSYTSFLFSITNQEKYPLVYGKKAIINCKGYGPVFGPVGFSNFSITDKANTSKLNHCYSFPQSYNNGKYIKNQQAFTAFAGPPQGFYFNINEWQVFEVIFN